MSREKFFAFRVYISVRARVRVCINTRASANAIISRPWVSGSASERVNELDFYQDAREAIAQDF